MGGGRSKGERRPTTVDFNVAGFRDEVRGGDSTGWHRFSAGEKKMQRGVSPLGRGGGAVVPAEGGGSSIGLLGGSRQ
jgi:hypothetical protein